MKKLLLIVCCISMPLQAATRVHPQWGIGESGDSSKYLSFAFPRSSAVFEFQPEIGGWFDNRKGAVNSLFTSYMIGIEPRSKFFYAHYLLGPALISSTDSKLGSNFQFSHELGVGFKDSRNLRLGAVYRHFSNAGIVQPNEGRDFIGLSGEFSF